MLRLLLALFVALIAHSGSAFEMGGIDKGEEIKPGIFYLKTTTDKGNVLHFVTVDLSRGNLVRVSKHTEGVKTPKQFARNTNSFVAVNGDFFDYNYNNVPLGLSIGEGARWPRTQVMPNWYILACDKSNNCEIRPYAKTQAIDSKWHNVMGGRDLIAKNGVPWKRENDNSCPHLCPIEAPRTAVGLTADKKTLIIGLAEGYAEEEGGMRVSEMAGHMVAQGASDVLHLDGGGSSQLVIDGELKSKRPDNEPSERIVGNILGILLPKVQQ